MQCSEEHLKTMVYAKFRGSKNAKSRIPKTLLGTLLNERILQHTKNIKSTNKQQA